MAQTGFEAVGLKETIKLLGKVDKELRGEATLIVREASKRLQAEARSRIAATPGVRRQSYHGMPKGAVTRRATATSGRVGINTGRYPVAGPAEFGWKHQFVPYRSGGGRFMPQSAMKRRTFPIWRGNQSKFPKYGERLRNGPGWIVQPVLRRRLGKVQQEVNEGMLIVFQRSARRLGVPR